MEIRKGTMNDLPAILQIYEEAREFMKEQGISRSQILGIFSCLPELGVTVRFREALANGEF